MEFKLVKIVLGFSSPLLLKLIYTPNMSVKDYVLLQLGVYHKLQV